MSEFTERIRALSPEQLALVARQLGLQSADSTHLTQPLAQQNEGSGPPAVDLQTKPHPATTSNISNKVDPDSLLTKLDHLSDTDVDAALAELLGSAATEEDVAPQPVHDKQAKDPESSVTSSSDAPDAADAQQLLAQIASLSNDRVNSLLKELLGDERRSFPMSIDVTNLSPEEKRSLLARLLRDKARLSQSYPLSFSQERLWFLDQFQPTLAIYNIPMPLSMPGALNLAALQQALSEIVRRHEILRTTFPIEEGKPVQRISPPETVPLPIWDLRAIPSPTREAEAQRIMAEETTHVFELAKGPLFRAVLLWMADFDHTLMLTMHHIVSDGWSSGVLMHELGVLYDAFANGRPSPLAELPIQYADFAQRQRDYLSGKVLDSLVSYWRDQLKAAPTVVELPTDRPRPAVQTFRGAWQTFPISRRISDAIKTLGRKEGVTLFMTLLAAFKTLLYRYSGQEDLVVGTPIANRNRADIEGLIGFFVNTLVLRTDLSGNPTFRSLLGRVREVTLGAYAHQDLPFEKLVMEVQPERNLSHNPLFQVLFALQNTPTVPQQPAPEATTNAPEPPEPPIQVVIGTAKFDLTLNIAEGPTGLSATFEYNTDLFDHATITRMIGHFKTLLAGISANPDQRLSDLPLLTQPERDQLLIQWNDTKVDFRQDSCVHQLFEEQVDRTPDAPSVIFEDQQLTYRELDSRANRLAHHLRKLGVGPEVCVGVCLQRSLDLVIGLMGIFKAGGAYVPLDPDYPKDRLSFVLQDAKAPVVLSQKGIMNHLATDATKVVCLDADWETIQKESDERPENITTPDNLLTVYYTSGSTGTPKGSMMHARGYLNLFDWHGKECAIPGARVLLMTPYAFDASFKSIITPLLKGGAIVLAGPDSYDIPKLHETIEKQKPTTTFTTPSLLYGLLDLAKASDYSSMSSLRSIRFGGETTDVSKLRPWIHSANCNCTLLHDYGPSECSDATTEYIPTKQELDVVSSLPIGKPIQNVNAYVVDKYLNLQPVGVPGELCLSGVCLSRGYLNRPELTAEKFIQHPFRQGEKLYRTGDRVKWLPTGNLEFLGRIDTQVKIRGIRIELSEIELMLDQHPAVRDAVVVAQEDSPGHKRLVGYVVLHSDQTISIGDLRRYLKEKLPDYMVPAIFVVLDSLPLSPNGKVDRAALPPPDPSSVERDKPFAPARNPVEDVVAGVWAEVLHLQKVSIHDNFFDLGGHSLLATQVISRLKDAFRLNLPLRLLFEAPTVAELSESLAKDPDHGTDVENTAQLLVQMADLSDEEINAKLREKTSTTNA